MKDRFPKWWYSYLILKSLFYVVGILSLVFYGTAYMIIAFTHPFPTTIVWVVGVGCWVLLFAPFGINYIIAKKRNAKIRRVIDKVKETGYFNPDHDGEYWVFWQSDYLGFDFKRGTALYVRIYPGNVMDVIGFDAYSLTRTEVEGSKLRLFTRFTSLPMIPIDTGAASNIANRLHAMNNKGYSYNFNFNDIVNKKRAEIEALTGLPVPVLV